MKALQMTYTPLYHYGNNDGYLSRVLHKSPLQPRLLLIIILAPPTDVALTFFAAACQPEILASYNDPLY